MKNILPFFAALAVAGTLSAQTTTVLSEDFSTWPPAGWALVNNNGALSQGWIQDAIQLRAWHEDEFGGHTADNTLMSPAMDLTGMTNVYLHFNGETNFATYLANHPSSVGDGVSNMEVTTDGGLTWTVVWTDTSLNSGDTYAPTVDLSAYAGMVNVQVGVHFYGTFAQEWWVDNVVVDDNPNSPPPPPTTWNVNLPTTFAPAPFTDNFDTNAGVVPSYMALTNVDSLTGLPDVEAWCNVGQVAPCISPNSGAYNLEMGLDPASVNYHNVLNAMVIGIAGNGSALNLDFMGINGGEESNPIDGVWISNDGANWYAVSGNWATTLPTLSAWQQVLDMDLTATPVDTTTNFYLMFAQEDNFPYLGFDGIGIDDIVVDSNTGGGGLSYTITNLVAGQTALFAVTGATPGGTVMLGYSLTGAGPTNTAFGVVDMSLPINTLATLTANGAGDASFSPPVPGNATGLTLYTQGLDLASGTLTNSLAPVVQ